jgi:mRNA interferase YafQ
MREIKRSSRFKCEYKLMKKRGKDMDKINSVILMLVNDEELPVALCDHQLSGNWAGFRDCHIEPDWLLIYKKTDDHVLELQELRLEATGTHSDLFNK